MSPSQTSDRSHQIHWGYEGDVGPTHWGELCQEFALCGQGKSQSPIDIREAQPKPMIPVAFDYGPTPLVICNNSHTIQVPCGQPNAITLDGAPYELQQFHFHAPSEHTVDGRYAAMEVHLVHQSRQGDLAVVGVLMEPGAVNTDLAALWAHLPPAECPPTAVPGLEIDPSVLLPTNRRTYRYTGSLTTPPGTESVRWVVMVEPIHVSPWQVRAFEQAMATYCPHGNYRPIQPLNDRTIWVEAV
jgi:carbonic anhydrase